MNLKKFIKTFCLVGGGLFLLSSIWMATHEDSNAAQMTSGYTPTNGQAMSVSQFLQAFTSGTVTNITSADINAGAVTLSKMAADSVSSSKLVNLTVLGGTGGDIAYNTIETTNILAGAFNGREMSSTFNWPSGTLNFTNTSLTINWATGIVSSSAVLGTNFSTGSSMSGLVPKLNTAGKLDPTLYYASTNKETVISVDVAAAAASTLLCSVTTTATNGTVLIFGLAQFNYNTTGAGDIQAALDDGTTTMDAGAFKVGSADFFSVRIPLMAKDTLTGSAKTYNIRGRASGGVGTWELNGLTDTSNLGVTNACRIEVIEIPRQ